VSELLVPGLFAALMALEYGYNLAHGGRYQTPRDSATSLMLAIPHFATLTLLPVVWVVLYTVVARAIPWQLPLAWWSWPLGVLAIDLATYWMHRYHHALNVTWAVHSVHHSSEEYTMSTGTRASMAEPFVNAISGAYVILVAPALLGLPLPAALAGWIVKDIWGTAVHTRNIATLGPLEWVLATPSHHRVHHATNPIYRGKNFGFITIVWDRLFGTFQPELASEPPIYGTEHPPQSFHPIVVAFHELARVWRAALATRRWRDKLRIWFMPAGWRPDDVPDPPTPDRAPTPPPPFLYAIGGAQLVYLLAASFHLAVTMHDHGVAANVAYLGFLIFATAISGDYFERSRRYTALESVRALLVLGMIAATGTWFGRPLDAITVALGALAAANLIAAWAIRLPRLAFAS